MKLVVIRDIIACTLSVLERLLDKLSFEAARTETRSVVIDAAYVNEAYERVLASDVRYRFVIDTTTI